MANERQQFLEDLSAKTVANAALMAALQEREEASQRLNHDLAQWQQQNLSSAADSFTIAAELRLVENERDEARLESQQRAGDHVDEIDELKQQLEDMQDKLYEATVKLKSSGWTEAPQRRAAPSARARDDPDHATFMRPGL